MSYINVHLSWLLPALACLSLALTLWQWVVAWRFPLHQRPPDLDPARNLPPLTLLKPLKGCDQFTESCLRSWLEQRYAAPVQILFGVASAEDPVCEVVHRLLKEYPHWDAGLVVCPPTGAANAKVDTLCQLESQAKAGLLIISDADVRVPADFLKQVIGPFSQATDYGLSNCFYRLANPVNLAMRWEAVAINADFWSQVLQSQTLKPLDFALGAVMAVRQSALRQIGGFAALRDCLADDYQLGNRIARSGHKIMLASVVAECWSPPMTWREVWRHQLRWARTIRVCQPAPYFFSILSNATLWPCLWAVARPGSQSLSLAVLCALVRVYAAWDLQRRLSGQPIRNDSPSPGALQFLRLREAWLPLLKDILQLALWFAAFTGDRIEWRGQLLRLRRDGILVSSGASATPGKPGGKT